MLYRLCLVFVASMISPAGAAQMTAPQPAAPDLAQWRKCIADCGPLYEQGRFAETARVLETAVHYAEHFPGLDIRLPETIHTLAFVDQQMGNYKLAAVLYQRAIRLWAGFGPDQRASLWKSEDNLVATYIAVHNLRSAEGILTRRAPEMEQSVANWRDLAALFNTRAALAHLRHRDEQAETLLRHSVTIWEEHVRSVHSSDPDDDRDMAIVFINLSQVLMELKRYREALDMESRAITILERLDTRAGILTVRAMTQAALLYAKLGNLAYAEQYFQRALEAARKTSGPGQPVAGQIMLRYAGLLHAMKRDDEGNVMQRDAQAILRRRSRQQATVDVLDLMSTR
jgi:tetratricopeptide (TPR) repeat protein